jgi:hypothetical protein
MTAPPTPVGAPQFPSGEFELYHDDDSVIGLTVAKTYPSGWAIMRTTPPYEDACDDYDIGQYLAWCLTNREKIMETFGE